jgi:hypothetical protein
MSQASTALNDQLANALHTLGVHFIRVGTSKDESLHKQPTRLIASLAKSEEARLRLSLIPLFLEHPEFATHVRTVAKTLNQAARLTLQCYYSAAVWLGQKYQARAKSLPDYFSSDLGLQVTEDPEINLRRLAKRHQELSDMRVNWLGTYQHAAMLIHLEELKKRLR